eukprot:gene15816-7124_t
MMIHDCNRNQGRRGQKRTKEGRRGQKRAEEGRRGQKRAEEGRRGQKRAEEGRRGQKRAEEGRREQKRAEEGNRGQKRAEEGGRGQKRAEEGKRGQKRAELGRRGQKRIKVSREGKRNYPFGQQDNAIISDQLCCDVFKHTRRKGPWRCSQDQIPPLETKALYHLTGLLDERMRQKMWKKANKFERIKEFSNETHAIKRAKTETFVKEDYDD